MENKVMQLQYELPLELRKILDQNEKIIEINRAITGCILKPPMKKEIEDDTL